MQVVYVRLSAVDVREPESPLWPLLQVTRLGPHVSRCLLGALLPTAASAGYSKREGVRWSAAALTRLDAFRTCLWEQRAGDMVEVGPPSSHLRATFGVADNGALGPVRDVFDTYVGRLPGMASGTTKLYGWDKVRSFVSLCSFAHPVLPPYTSPQHTLLRPQRHPPRTRDLQYP